MRRAVSVFGVIAFWLQAGRVLSAAALLAVATGCGSALAQQTSPTAAGSNAVALPEIRVIGTTPLPPPRRRVARPAPRTAAAAAATPAAGPPAEPGAVDRDKIPANVQTLSAPAF